MDSYYKPMNSLQPEECNQFYQLRPLFREYSNPYLSSVELSEIPRDELSFKLENNFQEDLLKDEDDMLDNLKVSF